MSGPKHTGLVTLFVLLLLSAAHARQAAKMPHVVWITTGSPSIISVRIEASRQGMRELGYVEGKNILIEARGADNVRERRKVLAEELVRLKVDVIVTAGREELAPSRRRHQRFPSSW